MKLFSIFSVALAAVTTVTAAPVDIDSASTPDSFLFPTKGQCSAVLKWTEFCDGGVMKAKVLVTKYMDERGRIITEPGERLVGPST